ncbi:MAG: ComEA family DNA-binding protein [Micrococcales bacterium]|nr:ComEA family DNA-binding protein [Micrococcales bacterium]
MAAAGVVALVAIVVGLRTGTSVAGGPVDLGTPSPPAVAAPVPDVVVVHVVGAVARPGVFTLPGGSRVADAVEAAGGATDEADLAGVNLARALVDGEQLYVPRPGEVLPGAPEGPAGADDGLVDLNRASQSELETLPGVGPVIAGRIVAARPFASVDSLQQVSGIGPATMTRLRDLVKV